MSIWQPHPILALTPWGPLTSHAVAFTIASVVAAVWLGIVSQRYLQRTFADGVEDVVVVFVGSLIVAHFGYLVTYPNEWTSTLQLLQIWEGGLVSFWGIAAGIGLLRLRVRKVRVQHRPLWWQTVVNSALLAWAIGRVGNFYMGEAEGVLVSFGRVPVPLIESAWCLLLLAFLPKAWKRRFWPAVVAYLVGRFIIDIWRDEFVWYGLRMGQWAVLLFLVLIGGAYAIRRRRSRTH